MCSRSWNRKNKYQKISQSNNFNFKKSLVFHVRQSYKQFCVQTKYIFYIVMYYEWAYEKQMAIIRYVGIKCFVFSANEPVIFI